MNFSVSIKLKISFILIVFFVAFFGLNQDLSAQKVRLRAKITPNCTLVRGSGVGTAPPKFADIYADGNIAVQGSYGCNGAFIYDMTNPDAPVLASWYNPGNSQQFLEAIVIGNRGYFGVGNSSASTFDGVHIVDLSNPAAPVLLGKVNSSIGGGYDTIHEMMVVDQGGSRFLIENSNSTGNRNVKIIDITNPTNPSFKSQFTAADNGWVHAMHIRGSRMYTSEYIGTNVEIYDISNLASTQAPPRLGTINIGSSTSHSSWTSEDGNYLYSCRETSDGDMRVYNVSNPAQPLLIKSIKAGNLNINATTPHNPVVMGNYLYVAWYQAGLQIFDITNPADPVRVGQYDTFQPAFAPPAERENDSQEPWDVICGFGGGDKLRSAQVSGYDGNWAVYPFLGQNKVLAGDLTGGLFVIDASSIAAPDRNHVSDFDGDGKTDFSVFSPASSQWNIENSSNGANSSITFGFSDDKIVPGDYDGDAQTDVAIFRPSTGTWWIRRSSNPTNFQAIQFGLNGDVPVPGDYDADGRTDVAVWRPSTGVWYISQSSLGVRIVQWGLNGDKAFTGDYEGDGKADLAIYRNGTWYISLSSSSLNLIGPFGLSTDKPVSADFDGDGKSDLAVYRPSEGNWYWLNSGSSNSLTVYRFGLAADIPIPADYDGDGRADIAVFRPSDNVWYRLNSSNGAFNARQFGQTGDKPSPASVQPQ